MASSFVTLNARFKWDFDENEMFDLDTMDSIELKDLNPESPDAAERAAHWLLQHRYCEQPKVMNGKAKRQQSKPSQDAALTQSLESITKMHAELRGALEGVSTGLGHLLAATSSHHDNATPQLQQITQSQTDVMAQIRALSQNTSGSARPSHTAGRTSEQMLADLDARLTTVLINQSTLIAAADSLTKYGQTTLNELQVTRDQVSFEALNRVAGAIAHSSAQRISLEIAQSQNMTLNYMRASPNASTSVSTNGPAANANDTPSRQRDESANLSIAAGPKNGAQSFHNQSFKVNKYPSTMVPNSRATHVAHPQRRASTHIPPSQSNAHHPVELSGFSNRTISEIPGIRQPIQVIDLSRDSAAEMPQMEATATSTPRHPSKSQSSTMPSTQCDSQPMQAQTPQPVLPLHSTQSESLPSALNSSQSSLQQRAAAQSSAVTASFESQSSPVNQSSTQNQPPMVTQQSLQGALLSHGKHASHEPAPSQALAKRPKSVELAYVVQSFPDRLSFITESGRLWDFRQRPSVPEVPGNFVYLRKTHNVKEYEPDFRPENMPDLNDAQASEFRRQVLLNSVVSNLPASVPQGFQAQLEKQGSMKNQTVVFDIGPQRWRSPLFMGVGLIFPQPTEYGIVLTQLKAAAEVVMAATMSNADGQTGAQMSPREQNYSPWRAVERIKLKGNFKLLNRLTDTTRYSFFGTVQVVRTPNLDKVLQEEAPQDWAYLMQHQK